MQKPPDSMIATMDRVKSSLREFSVCGLIIFENEVEDEPTLEYRYCRTDWAQTAFQRLALREMVRLPAQRIPEHGPGITSLEHDILVSCRMDLVEHFRTGVIFLIYGEREGGIEWDAAFWGDTLSAAGLLEVWRREFDADSRKANADLQTEYFGQKFP